MKIGVHPLGVCSWSLRADNLSHLISMMQSLGLEHVQLALGGLLAMPPAQCEAELAVLKASPLKLLSGMIGFPGEDYRTIAIIQKTGGYVPDDLWPARRQLSRQAAELAVAIGTKIVTTHVGHVAPDSGSAYQTIVHRTKTVANDFAELGVDLLIESGPEPAEHLARFVTDVAERNLFVNFDPANMILYGDNPAIESLRILAPYTRQVHLKDALPSAKPGVDWGQEVPFGTGNAHAQQFLAELDAMGFGGAFVIEREGGNDRLGDVRKAIDFCRQYANKKAAN